MKFVKLFTLIAAAALALSVTSCSKDKDSDSPGNYRQMILGTWNLSTAAQPTQGIGDMPASSLGVSVTLTFYSDGTWTGYFTGLDGPSSPSGPYSISGKMLVLDEGGGIMYQIQIVSMTDSKMVLKFVSSGEVWTFVR